MPDEPLVRCEINCVAWTANNLREEAAAELERAEVATDPERERGHRARVAQLEALATRTLTDAGFDPDAVLEAVRYIPLTPEEIDQRERDAESALVDVWRMMRAQRDDRLMRSDWTQLADANLPARDLTAWNDYRQALRDLPTITTDPSDPPWPTPPNIQR